MEQALRLLLRIQFHYRIDKVLRLDAIRNQMNPFHILVTYFLGRFHPFIGHEVP